MKTKKIIKAIKQVRNYCSKFQCYECCFKDYSLEGDICIFRNNLPYYWDIEQLEKQLEPIKEEHLIRKVKQCKQK